jgi:hypothetical protein
MMLHVFLNLRRSASQQDEVDNVPKASVCYAAWI